VPLAMTGDDRDTRQLADQQQAGGTPAWSIMPCWRCLKVTRLNTQQAMAMDTQKQTYNHLFCVFPFCHEQHVTAFCERTVAHCYKASCCMLGACFFATPGIAEQAKTNSMDDNLGCL
jgi:hypothetical protein